MRTEKQQLATDLAKARGLGSAKTGTHHWWLQRVTAVALIPLSIWFMSAIIKLPSMEHAEAYAWLSDPWHGILMLLFVPTAIVHALLGVQVVIEDYVHGHGAKIGMLLATKFLGYGLAVTAVLAIIKTVIGA